MILVFVSGEVLEKKQKKESELQKQINELDKRINEFYEISDYEKEKYML